MPTINEKEKLETSQIEDKISTMKDLLPVLNTIKEQTFVIKCGNLHLGNKEAMLSLASDISILNMVGVKVIVVHGGGIFIKNMIDKLSVADTVIDNSRVVNRAIFEIAEMTLRGKIASNIMTDLHRNRVKSVNLSGRDNDFLKGDKLRRITKDEGSNIEKILDLGMVGQPTEMDTLFLDSILDEGIVPVISPILTGRHNRVYSVNADTLASFIAIKMNADKLFLLSDYDGFMDQNDKLLPFLSINELSKLIKNSKLPFNMIEKATSSLNAVQNGVGGSYILNGNKEHILLKELLSNHGVGTMIHDNKTTI